MAEAFFHGEFRHAELQRDTERGDVSSFAWNLLHEEKLPAEVQRCRSTSNGTKDLRYLYANVLQHVGKKPHIKQYCPC